MRVAWTIYRNYDRKHGKMLREDLINDLIEMGVPEELAQELIHKDSFQWRGELDNVNTFLALDILPDTQFDKCGLS